MRHEDILSCFGEDLPKFEAIIPINPITNHRMAGGRKTCILLESCFAGNLLAGKLVTLLADTYQYTSKII